MCRDHTLVLIGHAGANGAFAGVPHNMGLTTGESGAIYIDTGFWSNKALEEATKVTSPHYSPWRVNMRDAAPEHLPLNFYFNCVTSLTEDARFDLNSYMEEARGVAASAAGGLQ